MDWLAYGLPVEGEVGSRSRIGSVMDTDVLTCHMGDRVGDTARMAVSRGTSLAVVLNHAGVVTGVLRRKALDGDPGHAVEQAMQPGPSMFRPGVPVQEMIEFLVKRDLSGALVGTPDGRLVGAVTLSALQHAREVEAQAGQ